MEPMPILHVSVSMPTTTPIPTVATKPPEAEPEPAVGRLYPISSGVIVKRSNGEEALAYVKGYNVEKALYRVEFERLGSGQVFMCRNKDMRAANMVERLIASVRTALFTSRADDSDLNA
jgi:hypothetical protein